MGRWLVGASLLLAGASGWAQYKVVGPDGKITYTDQPPAAGASVQPLRLSGGGASADANLPASLREVAAKFPVTLYSAKDCRSCEVARSMLTGRGIPFSERLVESPADVAALQSLAGERTLPLLTIGKQQLRGFSSGEWSSYLDAAGYPATSALPKSYRYAAPKPLAPQAPVAAASSAADGAVPLPQDPTTGLSKSGIRF